MILTEHTSAINVLCSLVMSTVLIYSASTIVLFAVTFRFIQSSIICEIMCVCVSLLELMCILISWFTYTHIVHYCVSIIETIINCGTIYDSFCHSNSIDTRNNIIFWLKAEKKKESENKRVEIIFFPFNSIYDVNQLILVNTYNSKI